MTVEQANALNVLLTWLDGVGFNLEESLKWDVKAARAAKLLAGHAHKRLLAGYDGDHAALVVLQAGRALRATWPKHLLEAQGGEPASNPWWTP